MVRRGDRIRDFHRGRGIAGIRPPRAPGIGITDPRLHPVPVGYAGDRTAVCRPALRGTDHRGGVVAVVGGNVVGGAQHAVVHVIATSPGPRPCDGDRCARAIGSIHGDGGGIKTGAGIGGDRTQGTIGRAAALHGVGDQLSRKRRRIGITCAGDGELRGGSSLRRPRDEVLGGSRHGTPGQLDPVRIDTVTGTERGDEAEVDRALKPCAERADLTVQSILDFDGEPVAGAAGNIAGPGAAGIAAAAPAAAGRGPGEGGGRVAINGRGPDGPGVGPVHDHEIRCSKGAGDDRRQSEGNLIHIPITLRPGTVDVFPVQLVYACGNVHGVLGPFRRIGRQHSSRAGELKGITRRTRGPVPKCQASGTGDSGSESRPLVGAAELRAAQRVPSVVGRRTLRAPAPAAGKRPCQGWIVRSVSESPGIAHARKHQRVVLQGSRVRLGEAVDAHDGPPRRTAGGGIGLHLLHVVQAVVAASGGDRRTGRVQHPGEH